MPPAGQQELLVNYLMLADDHIFFLPFVNLGCAHPVASPQVLLLLGLFLLGTVLPEASRPQGSMGLQEVPPPLHLSAGGGGHGAPEHPAAPVQQLPGGRLLLLPLPPHPARGRARSQGGQGHCRQVTSLNCVA